MYDYPITQTSKKPSKGGGARTSSLAYIVIHCTESPSVASGKDSGAENVAAWFANSAATGSTQYVIDNDSIVQCLRDDQVAAGVAGFNAATTHIECCGYTSYTRQQWLDRNGIIDRLAWLIATLCVKHDIPPVLLSASDLVAKGPTPGKGKGGVTTHMAATATKALGAKWCTSDHTDPGNNFPLDVVMQRVKVYYEQRKPGTATPSTPSTPSSTKKDRATAMQKLLMGQGYSLPKYGADGAFGSESSAALDKWLKDNKL